MMQKTVNLIRLVRIALDIYQSTKDSESRLDHYVVLLAIFYKFSVIMWHDLNLLVWCSRKVAFYSVQI